MTDKQKQAITFINELRYDRKVITHEEYFLLLECVLGGEENTKWISRTILPDVPTLQCYEPNGVCTNPFRDCINCPKIHGGGAGTFTSTNIKDK